MLIIFEGPDRCGKTEIANELGRILKIPVYKSGREAEIFHDPDAQYLSLKWANYEMIKLLETTGADVIFDRFFPSEWVYAQVFERRTDLDLIKEYDAWVASMGAKIIWCDKPIMDGEDELVPASKYNELRDKYFDYMKNSLCDILYLNTSDHNLDAQVNEIYQFVMTKFTINDGVKK